MLRLLVILVLLASDPDATFLAAVDRFPQTVEECEWRASFASRHAEQIERYTGVYPWAWVAEAKCRAATWEALAAMKREARRMRGEGGDPLGPSWRRMQLGAFRRLFVYDGAFGLGIMPADLPLSWFRPID